MSENKKTFFGRGRRNFFTGLAVVLPVIISIGIALWLFNKAVDVSDILLYPFRFIPGLELSDIWKDATNGNPGSELFWWWEVVAIFEAVLLTGLGLSKKAAQKSKTDIDKAIAIKTFLLSI